MNQTIFLTVLLIISQVYHSSTNDISDWLIRQGSPFDKPTTVSVRKRFAQPNNIQHPEEQRQSLRRYFFPMNFLKNENAALTPIEQVRRVEYTPLPVKMRRDGTFYTPQSSTDVPKLQYEWIFNKRNTQARPLPTRMQRSHPPQVMHVFVKKMTIPRSYADYDDNINLIQSPEKPYIENIYIINKNNENDKSINSEYDSSKNALLYLKDVNKRRKTAPLYPNSKNSAKSDSGKKSNMNAHFWNTVSKFWKCVPNKCGDSEERKSNLIDQPTYNNIVTTSKPSDNGFPIKVMTIKRVFSISREPLVLTSNYGNMIRSLLLNQLPLVTLTSPVVHHRYKRSKDFQLPTFNFENTFLTARDINQISKEKLPKPVYVDRFRKFPYYKLLADDEFLKHSPFKYAEDMRTVPVKTAGGTEFYDSKSSRHCTEVESNVDPIPERIKNKMPEDHDREDERRKRRVKREFEQNRIQPRLRGLGDKIDCFKEKYFGVDPLDNPFFDEDVIEPPEPLRTPVIIGVPLEKAPSHNLENIFSYETFGTVAQFEPAVLLDRNKITKELGKSTSKRSFHSTAPNTTNKPIQNESADKDRIIISEQSTISLPAAIFDKYTSSQDPQTRVYGDVIGNIKSNLEENKIVKNPNFPPTLQASAEKNNLNNHLPRIYRAYTSKESIQIPISHSRFKRELNISQTLSTENKTEPLPEIANHTAEASDISETVADLLEQMTRKVNAPKVYTDIGKEERKVNQHIADEEASDTVNYEVPEETTQFKNHRRDYSPITTTKSISPEQLKIEYILKAAEDDELIADNSNNPDSTTNIYSYATQTTPYDDNDSDPNLENNQTASYKPNIIKNHRLQSTNSRRSESIFDVSAYIPRPTYLNSQFLRHNYSSKYNADALSEADKTDENTELPTTTVENQTIPPSEYLDEDSTVETTEPNEEKVYKENIRHTVERDPTTTPVPTTAFATSVYSQNKLKESRDSTGDRKSTSPSENTNKRSKSRVTNNSRNEDYATNTEPSRKIKVTNRKRNNKRVRIQKENRPTTTSTTTSTITTSSPSIFDDKPFEFDTQRNDYSYKESIPIPEDYPSTERYTTAKPVHDISRNSRRGKRPQRQHQRRQENVNRVYQNVPRKPKILEKTSKKRKTTVITNSKRYDNNNMDNDFRNTPTERQNRFDYNNDKTEIPVSEESQDTNLSDRDSNVSDNNGAIEAADSSNRDVTDKRSPNKARNKDARRRPPVNEESRYEEDVEEEEIIQERSTPYHGPELAKKINSLSDNEEEMPYRIDNDGEDYRSHTISGDEPKQELSNNKKQFSDYDDDDLIIKRPGTADGYVDSNNYRRTRSGSSGPQDKGISAHVLKSFVSLMDITTTEKPPFEKDPSKRLYFYAKLH